MSIIYWIIFGLIAGAIANFIAPNSKGGIIESIVLGILGAIVGGYLGETFLGIGITGLNLPSIAVAVVGSLIVLFIGRVLLHGK